MMKSDEIEHALQYYGWKILAKLSNYIFNGYNSIYLLTDEKLLHLDK